MRKFSVILLVIFCIFQLSVCDKKHKNKYSAEANQPYTTEKYDPDFRNIQRPFRMAKLNLVWSKAQHRLTEPKLKSLYMELKIHDKEEITWKQLSSQHKDKDGLKEAELRKKLIGIMSTYDLLEHFDETQDPAKVKEYRKFVDRTDDSYMNKSLFKDKKLNRLWEKAEIAGFTPEELKALKEEFQHHQDKIDMYYSLLDKVGEVGKSDYHENAVNEEELDRFNEITNAEETINDVVRGAGSKHQQYTDNINKLRDHHRGIKDNYDRLERIAGRGPNSQDFIEPKVQGLWRIALASNFTEDELSSLKYELQHYESRLLKLRHLHAEHALHKEKYKKAKHNDKKDRFEEMEEHIKKQSRKVEKLHESIESKLFKHSEL